MGIQLFGIIVLKETVALKINGHEEQGVTIQAFPLLYSLYAARGWNCNFTPSFSSQREAPYGNKAKTGHQSGEWAEAELQQKLAWCSNYYCVSSNSLCSLLSLWVLLLSITCMGNPKLGLEPIWFLQLDFHLPLYYGMFFCCLGLSHGALLRFKTK